MKKIQPRSRAQWGLSFRFLQAMRRLPPIACGLAIACAEPSALRPSSLPVSSEARGGADQVPLAPTRQPGNIESRHDFVDIARLDASIRVDLRYATANNFTGQAVYPPSARCYLRARVAQRLQAVQRELSTQRLGLKVFDCYRPLSVQRRFFALVPDERYVANPSKGSRHNRGAAVDLTLVDAAGAEQPMPTSFDDFSERAHRDFMALPNEAIANRARLEAAMTHQGFVPLPTEWWHFDDRDAKTDPLADVSFDELARSNAH